MCTELHTAAQSTPGVLTRIHALSEGGGQAQQVSPVLPFRQRTAGYWASASLPRPPGALIQEGCPPPQPPCCLGVTPQGPQLLPRHQDPSPALPLPQDQRG